MAPRYRPSGVCRCYGSRGAYGIPTPSANGRHHPGARAGACARPRTRAGRGARARFAERARRQGLGGSARSVTLHEFEPTHFHVTIGPHEPVLRVASGDTIRTWTVDSGGYDRNGEEITEGGNPQTGPFYVEGAEPGDTLSVRFDRIRPHRARGVTGGLVALNVVDPAFAPE